MKFSTNVTFTMQSSPRAFMPQGERASCGAPSVARGTCAKNRTAHTLLQLFLCLSDHYLLKIRMMTNRDKLAFKILRALQPSFLTQLATIYDH